MKRVYLDSNILVAYYAAEDKDKELVSSAIKSFASFKVALSVSMWTIAEMVKVLINEKKMSSRDASKIANNFIQEPKLRDLKIYFIKVHPKKSYEFDDFFTDTREKMILYNPGWGDAMHAVIMKNNGIKEILTLDGKDDFKIMPGIRVIHPGDLQKPTKPTLLIRP